MHIHQQVGFTSRLGEGLSQLLQRAQKCLAFVRQHLVDRALDGGKFGGCIPILPR